MRERVEATRFAEQQRMQSGISIANEEANQLKATVRELRDEMERQKSLCEESIRDIKAASHDEVRQLQLTIIELREHKEHGKGTNAREP